MRGNFTVLLLLRSFARSVIDYRVSQSSSSSSSLPPAWLLLTLTGVTCEERNHLKCHDKYFTAAAATAAPQRERWFFWRRTLEEHYFVGKSRARARSGDRRKERKKDTHGTAKGGREGGREGGRPARQADMRVVQCLIHASAVSDSVGNAAEAFASEVMAKLRVRKPGCCGCGCVWLWPEESE